VPGVEDGELAPGQPLVEELRVDQWHDGSRRAVMIWTGVWMVGSRSRRTGRSVGYVRT
jgi:hypothetical protein